VAPFAAVFGGLEIGVLATTRFLVRQN